MNHPSDPTSPRARKFQACSATTGSVQLRLSALPAVAMALSLVLSGCLSKPALRKELFLISPQPQATPAAAGTAPVTADRIQLAAVTVAAPFAGRSLVYRIADTRYEVDPYAEFMVAPDRMLDGAVRQWWRRAGVFQDVLEPGSHAAPTRLAELHVSEFHGDFRSASDPAAVVSLRFTLLPRRGSPAEPSATAPAAAITREVSRRVTARARTAAAVVDALQQALGEALVELSKEPAGR